MYQQHNYAAANNENYFDFLNIDMIFISSQSPVFHLSHDRSSWVEPILSKDKYVLFKDTMQ